MLRLSITRRAWVVRGRGCFCPQPRQHRVERVVFVVLQVEWHWSTDEFPFQNPRLRGTRPRHKCILGHPVAESHSATSAEGASLAGPNPTKFESQVHRRQRPCLPQRGSFCVGAVMPDVMRWRRFWLLGGFRFTGAHFRRGPGRVSPSRCTHCDTSISASRACGGTSRRLQRLSVGSGRLKTSSRVKGRAAR